MRRGQQCATVRGIACRSVAAVALAIVAALPVAAGPVQIVGQLPEGYAAIDIRPQADCHDGTLPGARCLPVTWLLDAEGQAPISFHALRWLLGTVGLTGAETLVVYAGPNAPPDDAWAVAALVFLAGQNRVALYTGAPGGADSGETRSFSREAVYTAAMRTGFMRVADKPATTLRARLIDFAQGGGTIAFAPTT